MVKITGIGWRLKFYFFLDFVVPINSMIQHTSPSAPHGHLTTAFSRVGYLNLTWVRQGIWTRIVQSFQWNKMSLFFSTRNVGIWTNQSSEVQTPSGVAQWGYPGRGVWCWSFVLIDTFCWKALRESFPRATKETMYKSLWSHKGLKPKQLSY